MRVCIRVSDLRRVALQRNTYWTHVDEPTFLLWALLNPRKSKLLIHFIVQADLLEFLRELCPILILRGHWRRRAGCSSTSTTSERSSESSAKSTLPSPRGREAKSPTSATRHGALVEWNEFVVQERGSHDATNDTTRWTRLISPTPPS